MLFSSSSFPWISFTICSLLIFLGLRKGQVGDLPLFNYVILETQALERLLYLPYLLKK